MAKALRDLLDADEPHFTLGLRELEKSSGNSGIDARLIGDIILKARHALADLGVDFDDVTAKEAYGVLKSHAASGAESTLLDDADYVMVVIDGEVISLNVMDLAYDATHDVRFENRSMSHARRSLRGEIVQRYASHPLSHEDTIKHHAKSAKLIDTQNTQNTESEIKGVTMQNKPSLLSIGDIFTDAFIQLDEEHTHATVEDDGHGNKRLCLPFGSKPQYLSSEIVKSVGPSPNASVSCARLGIDVTQLTWLGDDQTSEESRAHLESEHIDTSMIVNQADTASNYYYVLRHGADRTILVKNESYDYAWAEPANTPDWIYLTLIDEKSWQLHEDLLAYLEKNPEINLAFQPGTFHFQWGKEKLAGIYRRTKLLVLNREEAVDITGESYDSIKSLAKGLHDLGPEIVVITDGPNGSYASFENKVVTVPNFPDPGPPVDRTGAGDAFASTISAALALGESMETALLWAPINSMNVVQNLGAQAGLLNRDEIQEYLQNAPEWYKVSEYSEDN